MLTSKKVFIMTVMLLTLSAYSEKSGKYLEVGDMVVKIDSNDTYITIDKMNKHLNQFKKIGAFYDKYSKEETIHKIRRTGAHDTIEAVSVGRAKIFTHTEYKNLFRFGISQIELNSENLPCSIYFLHDKNSMPNPSTIQMLRKTGADISEFPIITDSIATKRAKEFVETIYGVEETAMFDSIRVITNAEGYMSMKYAVYFTVKVKNDIWDSRSASVSLNAFSGNVLSFHDGKPLLTKEDFNYIPKISKEQALEIYENECKKYDIDVNIQKVVLYKKLYSQKIRWHWEIHAWVRGNQVENQEKMNAEMTNNIAGAPRKPALIFIDSETGEILSKSKWMNRK